MIKKLLSLGMVATLLFSCSQDDSSSEIQQEDIYSIKRGDDVTSTVSMEGRGVVGVKTVSSSQNKQSQENAPVLNIALEQIATVGSPIANGENLRANHVDINGNFAYVAYTKEGDPFLGGIQVIDITDKYNPRVVEEMTAPADINALFVQDNQLYFTGATENLKLGEYHSVLGKFDVSGNSLKFVSDVGLTGYTGVDVIPHGNSVLVLTGNVGNIASFGPDNLNLENEVAYSDLRSAASHNGKLVVLSGEEGLLVLNSQLQTEQKISLARMSDGSKRTIAFYKDQILISEGKNGVGLYNLESTSETSRLPVNTLPENEVAAENKVTNAVSTTGDYVLMANGGSGFGITKLDDKHAISQEGIIDINGSVNYVKAVDNFIFVASGTGLQILKINRQSQVTQEDFLKCSDFPEYIGGNNFDVKSNDDNSYSGVATVKHLNVSASLNFCGVLNVSRSANINSKGEFNMSGSLAVGAVGKNDQLTINSNSVLRIQGSLTIYGDLHLNSGSTIEFVGDNSTIHIYGEVKRNKDAKVLGEYSDTSNKL